MGSAVVTGGDNPLVFDNQTTNLAPGAVGPAFDHLGHHHKIFIPCRPFIAMCHVFIITKKSVLLELSPFIIGYGKIWEKIKIDTRVKSDKQRWLFRIGPLPIVNQTRLGGKIAVDL